MSRCERGIAAALVLLFFASSLIYSSTGGVNAQAGSYAKSALGIKDLSDEFSYENVLNHVNAISSFGSRLTGYAGAVRTAEYIANQLASYGLEVTPHSYKTVVPADEGSSVTILGSEETTYEAYAVWPNGIQTSPTPPDGLSGPLVYVGKGEMKDFNGKEVSGSVVLMDYESGSNWITAAKFGAKGTILIAPLEPSIYSEALAKFVDTPLYFPRLYVTHETGLELIEAERAGLSVRIHARIYYREITAENVIGILPGSETANVIIVSSYYDSWAPVPAFANSPLEAISTAYLLELARVMSKTEPLRTVWFVFFSGHWQALSGAREFVEDYYFGPSAQNGSFKPLMLLNVGNLDPLGSGLQVLRGGAGTLYATVDLSSGITLRYSWVRRQIFTVYLHDPDLSSIIQDLTGATPATLVGEFFTHYMFWGTENSLYMLDSEPAELTRGVSFTIQTAYASKQWIGDPSQAYEFTRESLSSLAPQFIIIGHVVSSFVNEPQWGVNWDETSPSRVYISPGGFSQYSGFITLKGETLEYNLTRGWYNPVPHALVRVSMGMVVGGAYYPYPYPFNKYMTYSDENGTFELHCFSPYPFIPGRYIVDAWVVNETSGKIIYAPDLGVYGSRAILPVVSPVAHPEKSSVVLMKVGTITLYDVINPKTGITGLVPDSRSPTFAVSGGWFYNRGGLMLPQDFAYKGEPLFYGAYYNGYEPVALAFALPRSRAMVMTKSGGLSRTPELRPFLILVNSTETNPEGEAITISGESPSMYDGNALRYAEDIIRVTRFRYEKLSSHGVRSISVEEKLAKAELYLEEAELMHRDRQYYDAYAKALDAWALGSRTYDEVMTLIDDSGRTSLFFFALIIPAAILLERLFLHSVGKRQVISVLIIGTVLLVFFGFVHPALTVMTNSTMAILGLLAFTLFAITAAILGDETQKMLKELSYRILGYHTVETGRVGLATTAFTVSIENMRKRKFRTFLVFINLITISFALTSLTSISPYIGVKYVPWGMHVPAYTGILIKNSFSVPPADILGPYTADVVRGIVGGEAMVLPRSWYYPPSIGPNIGVVTRLMTERGMAENRTYQVNAMLGLTPEDIRHIFPNYSTTPILSIEEGYYCLIPSSAAEILEADLGDYVITQGIRFRVIGIYNTTLMTTEATRDLSGLSMSPTDPYYIGVLGIGATVPLVSGQQPPQLAWSRLIVIPYDVAIELGGYVAEISIRFPPDVNTTDVIRLSQSLADVLDLTVYVGVREEALVASRVSTFSAFGLEGIIIILVMGSLNVVATLLNMQRERIKDMYVYTTVGLSPGGAIAISMLEAVVYSLLGVLIGYFLGFVGNAAFRGLGMLPETFTFNYASLFAMLSLAMVLVAALISSAYPSYLASRLITPSLERKWKPPTKPKEGLWEIPLPVKISELDEVRAILTFLREYYLGVGAERPSFRVLKVYTESMSTREPKLYLEAALAPYEAGTIERININALWNEKDKNYDFTIILERMIGVDDIWVKGSYAFVDDLRTQILLWRFLSVENRNKYIQMARKEA